jgi:hypothetical protein
MRNLDGVPTLSSTSFGGAGQEYIVAWKSERTTFLLLGQLDTRSFVLCERE